MAESAELVVKISATTELLRQQMLQLDSVVAKSAAKTEASLGKIDGAFAKLGKGGQALNAAFTGAVAGAVAALTGALIQLPGALISAAKAGLDYASSIGEAAQAAGVGTRFLQEFRYAVEQNGGTVEGADNALSKFSVTLGRAFDGNRAATDSFTSLGISMKDLAAASDADRFNLVADAIARLPDAAQRAAAAQSIFGKGFKEILPLLEQGAKGFNLAAAEARQFGLVLSDRQIQDADKTADKIQALNRALDAKIAGAVADNAAAIGQLTNALVNLGVQAVVAANRYLAFGRAQSALKAGDAKTFATDPAARSAAFTDVTDRMTARLRAAGGNEAIARTKVGTDGTTYATLERQRNALLRMNIADRRIQAALAAAQAKATRSANVSVVGLGGGGGGGGGRSGGGGGAGTAGRIRETKREADAAIPSFESLARVLEDVNGLFNDTPSYTAKTRLDGPSGADQIDALLGKTRDLDAEYEANANIADDYRDRLNNATDFAARQFEDLFRGGIGDVWDNFQRLGEQVIAEVAAKFLIAMLSKDGLSGAGGIGGILSSALGSVLGFADGGSPPVGKISMVGERGPELFVPRVPGTIISNDNLRGIGGGAVQNITINAPGATAETVMAIRREIAAAAPALIGQAKRETMRDARRPRL